MENPKLWVLVIQNASVVETQLIDGARRGSSLANDAFLVSYKQDSIHAVGAIHFCWKCLSSVLTVFVYCTSSTLVYSK